MADEELCSSELPDVGFDGDGAGGDGGEERDASPVVIVGVDRTGENVAGEGGGVGG